MAVQVHTIRLDGVTDVRLQQEDTELSMGAFRSFDLRVQCADGSVFLLSLESLVAHNGTDETLPEIDDQRPCAQEAKVDAALVKFGDAREAVRQRDADGSGSFE